MRIVIVDDHPLILEGIANILRSSRHQVVAARSDARGLLPLLDEEEVDAVTLDIGMPELNGIEVARQIRQKLPRIRILFVTQQADVLYLRAAMEAGADAFIAKHAAGTELILALDEVLRGRKYVSPNLLDGNDGRRVGLEALQRKEEQVLTPRQREVLQLVAEGKSLKEIAGLLNISTKTVEFHKQALMTALGVRSTAELTRYAITHGHTFL